MSTNKLYIPSKIKIGYQDRAGTYTGKLAYVIYFDHTGKLRKEASWNSWRDHKIEPIELDNTPREGFVLNKGVGGTRSHWNHRNEYIRVYDPRGHEFEISVANLLFILQGCDCTKGKGLEGKFVYAWDKTELVLLPENSLDFQESTVYTKLQGEKVAKKDLVIGGTYLTKDNKQLIYIDRLEVHNYRSGRGWKNKQGKAFVFKQGEHFVVFEKFEQAKLATTVSDECIDNYAELMDEFQKSRYGSKVKKVVLRPFAPKNSEAYYETIYTYDSLLDYYYEFYVHKGDVTSNIRSNYSHYVIKFNDGQVFRKYHYSSSYYKSPYDTIDNPRKDHLPDINNLQTLVVVLESGSEFPIKNWSFSYE